MCVDYIWVFGVALTKRLCLFLEMQSSRHRRLFLRLAAKRVHRSRSRDGRRRPRCLFLELRGWWMMWIIGARFSCSMLVGFFLPITVVVDVHPRLRKACLLRHLGNDKRQVCSLFLPSQICATCTKTDVSRPSFIKAFHRQYRSIGEPNTSNTPTSTNIPLLLTLLFTLPILVPIPILIFLITRQIAQLAQIRIFRCRRRRRRRVRWRLASMR